MDRSIETIWQEGFLNGDALVAPKVNNLYNQRSRNLIDRFQRKFRINLILIVVGAAIVALTGAFTGAPFVGLFLFLQFMLLVGYSWRELKALNSLDKGSSSYEYLKSFRNWLNGMADKYARFYRFFYPVFFIAFGIGMWRVMAHLGAVDKLLEKFDPGMWQGIPILWVLPLILVAILSGLFSKYIYREDLQSIYGREIKKLDEMISDMEELRK